MIELDFHLPLSQFPLAVKVSLAGPSVAVMGASGAGKTSLLETIAGLRKGAHGRIVVDGFTLMDSAARVWLPPEKRKVGYVPQDSLLFPHLTVEQNIRFGQATGDSAVRLEEAVALLELQGILSRLPSTLSGGEKQRVALARALATPLTLLLLDEPLASLDGELKERILPFLLRVRDARKLPMLYVTHQHAEARVLTDEVLMLENGAVKTAGLTRDVLGSVPLQGHAPQNVVVGTLEALEDGTVGRLRVSDAVAFSVPASSLPVGTRMAYALSPNDVLIATAPPSEISARNIFRARLVAVELSEPDLLLRLEAQEIHWLARLTRGAVNELKLEPGHLVFVAVKAHSFRPLR